MTNETSLSSQDGTGEYEEPISVDTLLRPGYVETLSDATLPDYMLALGMRNAETMDHAGTHRVLFVRDGEVRCLRFHPQYGTYEVRNCALKGDSHDDRRIHNLHDMVARFSDTVVSDAAQRFLDQHPDPGDPVGKLLDQLSQPRRIPGNARDNRLRRLGLPLDENPEESKPGEQ